MGVMVIAAYRPRPGKEVDLMQLMREHLPILRGQGLVTDRSSVIMRAKDRTILEVFEWRSADAIQQAHTNSVVLEMWARYNEACTYECVGNLPESKQMFSPFEPVDL
jgi:hypothetical protein